MRAALALVALVCLATAAVLLLREPGPAPGALPVEGRAAAAEPDPDAPLEAPPSAGTTQRAEAGAREPGVATPGPAAVTESVSSPGPLEPGGLVVRVVDAAGAPVAGVDVVLVVSIVGMGEDDRGRATSRAPDGLARIALDDLEELRAQLAAVDLGVDLRFRVVAGVAAAGPVRVDLDGWPADGQEVELALPPTGSVLVHVVDAAGTPVLEECSIGWWWLPADVAAARPDEGYERVKNHFLTATGGSARIDGLGLGLALYVQASAPGRVHASERGFVGPTVPGEVRELTLALGAPFGAVTLRVLDPGGRPLADTKLWATKFDDPGRTRHPASGPYRGNSFALSTDSAGVARIPYPPGEFEYRRRLDVERGSRGNARQLDPDWALGSVDLPRRIESGVTVDLGDVRLEPAHVIVAGHVVDGAGAPIPGADLRFSERFGTTRDHRSYNYPDGWVSAGPAGAFELRGVRDPVELGVTVNAKGFASLSVDRLELGDRALVLTLRPPAAPPPSGAVRLEVHLDEGVSFMRCLLKFRREGGGGRTPDWWAGAPIEIDRLKPGTYDVWVETRDGDFELGRVAGVVVADGEVTQDARLLPLDLRGTARRVDLVVVRPDGAPWRRQDVELRAPGVGRSFRVETDDEGRAAFIVPWSVTGLDAALDEAHVARITLGPSDEPVRVEFAP